MCRDESPGARRGASLSDGDAHRTDHAIWTRRSFVHTLGLSLAAGAGMLSGLPVRTFARSLGLSAMDVQASDRVLVLIQLNGGNDGLNTVVPYRQDPYFSLRPTIGLPYDQILKITPETGLHPALSSLAGRYGEGSLAIVEGVGYADPSLSHFRGTDIWLSGKSGASIPDSGWVGRSLDAAYPDFGSDPPDYPLAVQFGGTSSLLTLGPESQMGMSVQSIELFERLAGTGQLYRTESLPDTPLGDELRFVRTVANDSFRYAGALQEANSRVENNVSYPSGNTLAGQLAIVSRLIRGELGARIYHVSLGGFDTHSNQLVQQQNLFTGLSAALDAFLADLAATGHDERVLVATFSEFGRRVKENGSAGTDHGTAAPMFLVGKGVRGGVYGTAPDLSALDAGGNIRFGVDFRSVFGSVLRDWFGTSETTVADVLGGSWPMLGIVADPTGTATEANPVDVSFRLDAPFPNPFSGRTTIPLAMHAPGRAKLTVHDVAGRTVAVLFDGSLSAGVHQITFDAGTLGSGTYLVRATASGAVRTRTAVLVR